MYSIYHIPGIKIGCSYRVDERVKQQGYADYEILENHTDIDIASIREKVLQKEYGLEEKFIKTDYKQQIEFGKASQLAIKGKPGKGAKTQIKNKIGIWSLTKKERSKIQKNASKFGGTAQSQIERICPHCGKIGKGNGMFAFHFDRCKLKYNV